MNDIIDNNNYNNQNVQQAALPNATAVLVLGIISIVGCVFYGVIGLVCGLIALALHSKNKSMYAAEPARYENSFRTAKAGYICAIVGTSLSALYILILVFALIFAFNIAGLR